MNLSSSFFQRWLKWRFLFLAVGLVLGLVALIYIWSNGSETVQDDLVQLTQEEQQRLQLSELSLRLELLKTLVAQRRYESAMRLYSGMNHKAQALEPVLDTASDSEDLSALFDRLGVSLTRGEDATEAIDRLLEHIASLD